MGKLSQYGALRPIPHQFDLEVLPRNCNEFSRKLCYKTIYIISFDLDTRLCISHKHVGYTKYWEIASYTNGFKPAGDDQHNLVECDPVKKDQQC